MTTMILDNQVLSAQIGQKGTKVDNDQQPTPPDNAIRISWQLVVIICTALVLSIGAIVALSWLGKPTEAVYTIVLMILSAAGLGVWGSLRAVQTNTNGRMTAMQAQIDAFMTQQAEQSQKAQELSTQQMDMITRLALRVSPEHKDDVL